MAGTDRGPEPPSVDVRAFLDNARFGGYQKLLLALCFLTVFFDGFDVQAVAVAAPQLRVAMNLQAAELGVIFAAGSLGAIVSAFALSTFADRVGRRPLMIGSLAISGLLSFCYVIAEGFLHLLILRMVAGFTLAVAVTMAYTYSAELAPKRAAATAVMVTSVGYGLGVAATGFLSGAMIPAWGWQSVFYFGGGGTMLLAALLFFALPESVRVEALRPGREQRIAAFLRRVDPAADFPPGQRFHLDEEAKPGPVFGNLLSEGRLLPAVALWVSAFFINFVIYIFMQWLPSMVSQAGGGAGQAGGAVGWFKVGGIVGSFVLAAYIDRRSNPYPALSLFVLLSAATLLALSAMSPTFAGFIVAVALAGVCLGGPQYAWNALVARLFPTYVRAGGMAVYAGVSRTGAMTGPLVVGFLLQVGWTNQDIFHAAIAPVLLAAAIAAGLWKRERAVAARARAAA